MPRWGRKVRRSAVVALVVAAAGGCGGGEAAEPVAPPPALVTISVPDGLRTARATGVVVGDDRVLTVAHALPDAARSSVTYLKAREERSSDTHAPSGPARVLEIDRTADLALLAVAGVRGPTLRIAGSATGPLHLLRGRDGRLVRTAAGEADPHRAAFTDLRGRTVRRPVLRLRASVAPGDSGSPVLDAQGRLAGVLFAADDTHPGAAWATAGAAVADLVRPTR